MQSCPLATRPSLQPSAPRPRLDALAVQCKERERERSAEGEGEPASTAGDEAGARNAGRNDEGSGGSSGGHIGEGCADKPRPHPHLASYILNSCRLLESILHDRQVGGLFIDNGGLDLLLRLHMLPRVSVSGARRVTYFTG